MSGPPEGTSATLLAQDVDTLEALRAGDAGALRLVYDRYGGLAYSLAVRIVGDSGRAEDVVQEVMTALWRKPERFDPQRGTLRTWLLTAVRNRAIDGLRSRQRVERREVALEPEVQAGGLESDPWQAVSVGLERKALRDAMASIPAEQRQAIELSYFGGLSQVEVAAQLDLPLGTVKSRQRLGLEKLHSYLVGRGLIQR